MDICDFEEKYAAIREINLCFFYRQAQWSWHTRLWIFQLGRHQDMHFAGQDTRKIWASEANGVSDGSMSNKASNRVLCAFLEMISWWWRLQRNEVTLLKD